MKKRIVYFLFIIGVCIIGACSSKSDSDAEKLPGIHVPVSEMNSEIRLEPDPGMPQEHKNGETLGFLVRNQSSSTISFSQDFGIKIFKKQGAIWESVENRWGYPEGENILPTTKESPVGLAFFVLPDLDGLNESTDVRIVIIGHFTDKPTEQVGAYIDVLYEPEQ